MRIFTAIRAAMLTAALVAGPAVSSAPAQPVTGFGGVPDQTTLAPGAAVQACNNALTRVYAMKPTPPFGTADPAIKVRYEKAYARWQRQVANARACLRRAESSIGEATGAQLGVQNPNAEAIGAQRRLTRQQRELDATTSRYGTADR